MSLVTRNRSLIPIGNMENANVPKESICAEIFLNYEESKMMKHKTVFVAERKGMQNFKTL